MIVSKLKQLKNKNNLIKFFKSDKNNQPNLEALKKEDISKNKENQYFRSINDLISSKIKENNFIHDKNYNLEQEKNYTKKVLTQAALTVEQQMKQEKGEEKTIKRRSRRKYNGPKHDLSIQKYTSWQTYDRVYQRLAENISIIHKILVEPKYLELAFGKGKVILTRTKCSTREYDFEDVNLDLFLIFDYRQTQQYWGPNKEPSAYMNQQDLPRVKRIKPYLTEEQFWQSEERQEFRFECTRYADWRKFKLFIIQEVERAKRGEINYEQQVLDKFGPVNDYSLYERQYPLESDPNIFKYDKTFWDCQFTKEEQKKVVEVQELIQFQKIERIQRIYEEQYRITAEQRALADLEQKTK